jgi:broad specificity phosphatase PhoE
MLRAYFVRHGETDWNVEGRIQGMTDVELNATGISQAKMLAERLAEEQDFVALYTSTLRRAFVTGEIIGRRLGLSPSADKRLVERDMGLVEGMTSEQVQERYPDVHVAWKQGHKRVPFPEEEKREDFQRRLAEFLQDMCGRHTGHKVIVVTHGGAMGMIMATVMSLDQERRFPFWFQNGSFSIVEFGGAFPRLLVLNDTCHLRNGRPHPSEKEEFVLDEKISGEGNAPEQSPVL